MPEGRWRPVGIVVNDSRRQRIARSIGTCCVLTMPSDPARRASIGRALQLVRSPAIRSAARAPVATSTGSALRLLRCLLDVLQGHELGPLGHAVMPEQHASRIAVRRLAVIARTNG